MKKSLSSLRCLFSIILFLGITNCQKDTVPPASDDPSLPDHQGTLLGANFNEKIVDIEPQQIIDSKMEWVRVFVNINKFLRFDDNDYIIGIRQQFLDDFEEMSYLKALTTHTVNGKRIKIILSLKFDFKRNNMGVPSLNSPVTQYLIDITKQILQKSGIAEDIDILVVGNEPMWETPGNEVDKLGGFFNLLIDTLDSWKHNNANWNYQIYTGALNRASELQFNNAILKKVFDIAKQNEKIEGLDLHSHIKTITEANDDVEWVRKQGFNKELIVTEFSLHRLFQSRLSSDLNTWGSANGYPADMKLWQWLNELMSKAESDPISPDKFKSFFDAQNWYPQKWFSAFFSAYCQNDVKVATYGFKRILDPAFRLDANSPAWVINAYLNEALLGRDKDGYIIQNPLFADEVEEIVKQSAWCKE